MTAINATFDGKVFIPTETVKLPEGTSGRLQFKPARRKNKGGTAADLLKSPLVGMWADRTDISQSTEYARELRRQAETRSGRE
jgi:hypothetical protein